MSNKITLDGFQFDGAARLPLYIEITKTKTGSYTSPMEMGNTVMILKLEDSKEQVVEVDIKNRIKQVVEFETNRQLTQYSKIYYNKIKINTKNTKRLVNPFG